MNAVSNKILELFKKNNKSYTFDELRKSLGIRGEESLEIIKESLASLLVNGDLLLNDKKKYINGAVKNDIVLILNGQVDKKDNKISSVERIKKKKKDTFLYEVN